MGVAPIGKHAALVPGRKPVWFRLFLCARLWGGLIDRIRGRLSETKHHSAAVEDVPRLILGEGELLRLNVEPMVVIKLAPNRNSNAHASEFYDSGDTDFGRR